MIPAMRPGVAAVMLISAIDTANSPTCSSRSTAFAQLGLSSWNSTSRWQDVICGPPRSQRNHKFGSSEAKIRLHPKGHVQPVSSGHLRPFVQTPPTDLAGFKANGRLKHLNTLCARGVTL